MKHQYPHIDTQAAINGDSLAGHAALAEACLAYDVVEKGDLVSFVLLHQAGRAYVRTRISNVAVYGVALHAASKGGPLLIGKMGHVDVKISTTSTSIGISYYANTTANYNKAGSGLSAGQYLGISVTPGGSSPYPAGWTRLDLHLGGDGSRLPYSGSLTASRVVITDASGNLATSATIDTTELGCLNGVTSSIQNQLNARASWVSPWFGLERVLVSDAATGGQVNQSSIALADLLRVNGTLALTADWDAGSYEIRALTFESDIATMAGAPFTVASTAVVTNLNADTVDGVHASALVQEADYDANTVLAATSDNTPVTVTIAEDRILGRKTGGNIAALTPAEVNGVLDIIHRASTSDHTINNSDVYTQDTYFNGISLEANSIYEFEAAIVWRLVTSATPDWKVRFYFSQTDWTMFCTYVAAATASANESSGNYCTIGAITNTATGSRLNVFKGTIKVVTAGTFEMQWAQNTATAEDTLRRHPSWMRFIKVQ